MKIIDAQVNFGENVFGPDCDINKYVKDAKKMGITNALLIPTGTHVFERKDGILEKSCIWNLTSEDVLYEKILIKDGLEQRIINPVNPYADFNDYTLEVIKSKNKEGKIKFYFVPKIHPKLDEPSELERLLKKKETVALKIQGLATYCTPQDIPLWIPELVKKYDKPLIIHTDYLNKNLCINISENLKKIMNLNKPLDWAYWVMKQGVKAYLAHGIRLDKSCAEIVNKSKDLVVGAGPDMMIQLEKWRLLSENEDYLPTLFDLLDESKVLFSTDFAWNFKNLSNEKILDLCSIDRLKNYAVSKNKDNNFLEKVLYKNAKGFFKI